jgi:hypothetical protein
MKKTHLKNYKINPIILNDKDFKDFLIKNGYPICLVRQYRDKLYENEYFLPILCINKCYFVANNSERFYLSHRYKINWIISDDKKNDKK